MFNNLQKAKEILTANNYTTVLYKDGTEYHSVLRGVKPLLDFLASGNDFGGFFAADKVVGAGAAHLYVLLGVKAVWANIISESGIRVLEANNITVFYKKSVPYIINRKGDGTCTIEKAVKDINDSKQALNIIKKTLKELSS